MILLILKSFLLGWFLANFEPLQEALKPVTRRMKDKYFLVWYLKNALGCHKCLSFWTAIVISANIYVAITAAILAVVFDKIMNR